MVFCNLPVFWVLLVLWALLIKWVYWFLVLTGFLGELVFQLACENGKPVIKEIQNLVNSKSRNSKLGKLKILEIQNLAGKLKILIVEGLFLGLPPPSLIPKATS